jgi:uncharacterized OB-fold protein
MSDHALLAAAAQLLGAVPSDTALATPELRFQRCDDCGYLRHPSASRCPECLGADFHWQPDRGHGAIWSFCVYHRAFDPAFAAAVPYNVALVELDSGPRLVSNVLGVEPAGLRIGLRVRAEPREVAPGRHLVYFVPDASRPT